MRLVLRSLFGAAAVLAGAGFGPAPAGADPAVRVDHRGDHHVVPGGGHIVVPPPVVHYEPRVGHAPPVVVEHGPPVVHHQPPPVAHHEPRVVEHGPALVRPEHHGDRAPGVDVIIRR